MKKKRLSISIASLVIVLLCVGLLQFVPISISFGENRGRHIEPAKAFLQPGRDYLIRVDKPMNPPDGMRLSPLGNLGAGFFHDGKRRDDPKRCCGGDITILLQDDGHKKYMCEKCKKIWDRIPESK